MHKLEDTLTDSFSGPEVVLQKQYRPPIGKIVIEVPAGLVDAGESPEQAAIRELKEETGYVATATESSPTMFNGTFAAFKAHRHASLSI